MRQYESTSAVETLIEKTGEDKAIESLLIKSPAAEAFIKNPTQPNCEASFLNHFTYISHVNSAKRLHPPFLNSYQSLVVNPSASPLKDNKKGDYSKVNIQTTPCINKIYFAIKIFNGLCAGYKNVSLEDAASSEAKLLLLYILRYYINAKISTQTHLMHGGGTKMSSLQKHSTSIFESHTSLELPYLFQA